MYTFSGHELEQTLGGSGGQRSLEEYSPWRTEQPGGVQPMESQRVGRDIVTEQHVHMDRHTSLFCPLEILHFLQIEGLRQP